MFLVDTHTHLYQPAFDGDRDDAMARCAEAGVDLLLLPNIDVESIPRVQDMMVRWPNRCRGMMGLHPCHVQEGWEAELQTIEAALNAPMSGSPWVAVGEIGLDLHWDTSTLDIQREALRIQLDWAKQRRLPVVIHVRKAFDELFEVLDAEMDDRLTGVVHCFTGGLDEANHALSYPAGCSAWRGVHLQEWRTGQGASARAARTDRVGDRQSLPLARASPGQAKRIELHRPCGAACCGVDRRDSG